MFLFYVCTKIFQKSGHCSRGDIIQGRTLFKVIRYIFLSFWGNERRKTKQIFRTLVNGMHFLHNSTQLGVHGNLRTSNCLVTSRWQLQITDFGLRELRATADEESEGYSFRYHPYITWSFLISVRLIFSFSIGNWNSVSVSGNEIPFRYWELKPRSNFGIGFEANFFFKFKLRKKPRS